MEWFVEACELIQSLCDGFAANADSEGLFDLEARLDLMRSYANLRERGMQARLGRSVGESVADAIDYEAKADRCIEQAVSTRERLVDAMLQGRIPMEPREGESLREFYENRGREQGLEQGIRLAVIAVLEARGIAVDDIARERILCGSGRERLEAWLRRAATVTSLDELFDAG